jgi:hypothetical protein
MTEALKTIQSFVAPVVVISANGLLCLAFYNRLAAVIGRLRSINKERSDLLHRLAVLPEAVEHDPEKEHLQRRMHILDELGHQLHDRAYLIRDALIYLLLAVEIMIACSLALGLGSLTPVFGSIALCLFVLGMAVMMYGVLKALRELHIALLPVLFEHEMMEEIGE